MPRREVIRPDFDPIVVTLDTEPQGVQREGNFGVDYQYIVNSDSGIMWLPKTGRDAIIASGARKGDQIEICKSQRGRAVTYVAHLVSDAKEPAMPPPQRSVAVAPQSQQEVRATALSQCLRVAIDDLADARDYARSKDLELDAPNFEDVRAIAITYFIQRSK